VTKLVGYDWLWVFWWAYFAVVEGISLVHESKTHGNDDWTLTHAISVTVPIFLRVLFLAWLAWHFLIAHKAS
jgi:hypothetical protein